MRGTKARGKLIAIGGAEDRKDVCAILSEFVRLAGGRRARIIVMTVATNNVKEIGDEYVAAFKKAGAGQVEVIDVKKREDAHSEEIFKQLEQATGIFFTGGDQLQITSIIGGSEMDRLLHRLNDEGTVIGGSSAGAAMMSNTMIVTGPPQENPRLGSVQLGPGMEFFLGGVIDTHFSERGRHGRLLTIVAQFPHDLGIGIDEDTAIIVSDGKFEVIGEGAVTVIDAGALSYSNVPEAKEKDALALHDIRLHVLPAGEGFDMENRRPIVRNHTAKKDGSTKMKKKPSRKSKAK